MSEKINICYMLGALNYGGTEILALDLCNNFVSEKFSLFLVYRTKGQLENKFIESGVPLFYLPIKKWNIIYYILRLRKLLVKYDIRIIHAHQPLDALHAKLAAKRLNVKIVLSHHGYIHSIKSKFLLKAAIAKVNLNFYVSNSCKKIYEGYFKKELIKDSEILYNGIDPKRLITSDKNLRYELNVSGDKTLMGMVGNFYPSTRDQLTVCKALGNIIKESSDFYFLFAGGASYEGLKYFNHCIYECKRVKASDNVKFLGSISNVSKLLASLDIFVYSTNYETFGIGLVEAMMSGLPCIINDHPTLLEITNKGKCCVVFKTGEPKDLSNKILYMMKNHEIRKKMALEIKAYALDNFSIKTHILNLLNHYNQLIYKS